MLKALKNITNITKTENGAVTNISTNSFCVDLFGRIGAMRHASEEDIVKAFLRAYAEDADAAMRILFFARDVRGGLGERRVFRCIIKYLAVFKPESIIKNIEYFGEYGRFDDLMVLMGTPCEKAMVSYIKSQLGADMKALEEGKTVSLMAKWLPSVNASNNDTVYQAKKLARKMGMRDAEYRKMLVALRNKIAIIENNLREKDYSFDYEKQPSKALFKYREAFLRNDSARYQSFIGKVNAGEATLHAGTLMPYEIVEPVIGYRYRGCFMKHLSKEEENTLNATWNSLPDFGGDENAIAVVDTSGSMYGYGNPMPAAVALSLGIYFAERNKGMFHNHFIEFSERPQLIEIKGETFADRLRYIASFNEIANTDIEAVFRVILEAAVKNNIHQSEMPAKIYLISDMEFDCCVENAELTNFENARKMYADAGYKLPDIIFWNVQSRNTQQPVKMNDSGVALVSGCTPNLFSFAASGELSPYRFMMDVIGSARYAKIAA